MISEQFPEWMTEVDNRMLGVECHEAIPWEHFGRLMEERAEMRIGAVEMKRYEECSATPAPDNDVIVAAVLLTWSHTLISTLKTPATAD
jgi:hypothetical protein